MNIAIINKDTLEIKNVYFTPDGSIDSTRPDVDDTVVQTLVPDNLDYTCIKALPDFSIVKDESKEALKMNQRFTILRQTRNQLLTESDWTQVADTPLSQEQREKWCAYRQALRDLPGNTTDLDNVVWPESP